MNAWRGRSNRSGPPTVEIETVEVKEEPLFRSAQVGDRVTILTPHGHELTGRVVFKFATHLVLNLGGKYGTPGIADEHNTVRVRRKKERSQ